MYHLRRIAVDCRVHPLLFLLSFVQVSLGSGDNGLAIMGRLARKTLLLRESRNKGRMHKIDIEGQVSAQKVKFKLLESYEN